MLSLQTSTSAVILALPAFLPRVSSLPQPITIIPHLGSSPTATALRAGVIDRCQEGRGRRARSLALALGRGTRERLCVCEAQSILSVGRPAPLAEWWEPRWVGRWTFVRGPFLLLLLLLFLSSFISFGPHFLPTFLASLCVVCVPLNVIVRNINCKINSMSCSLVYAEHDFCHPKKFNPSSNGLQYSIHTICYH